MQFVLKIAAFVKDKGEYVRFSYCLYYLCHFCINCFLSSLIVSMCVCHVGTSNLLTSAERFDIYYDILQCSHVPCDSTNHIQ